MQQLPIDVLALSAQYLNESDTKALSRTCKRWRLACETAHPWFRAGCMVVRTARALEQTKNIYNDSDRLWTTRRTIALIADTLCNVSRDSLKLEHGRKRKRPDVPYDCKTGGCFMAPCTNCNTKVCEHCQAPTECDNCRRPYCAPCTPRCVIACHYCDYSTCPKCTRTSAWYKAGEHSVCERCVLFRAGVRK